MRLYKAFTSNSLGNVKLSKTQMSKIGQSRGFLVRLLGPLRTTGFPLIKNELKPLGKSTLIPLGLTTAASETDISIQKKPKRIRHEYIHYLKLRNQ